jgi:predicted transcriptional regulator
MLENEQLNIIIDHIEERRKELGLTQWQLAKKASVSRSVTESLAQKRRGCYLHTLLRILNALDLNLEIK